jgi:hypothetical protein
LCSYSKDFRLFLPFYKYVGPGRAKMTIRGDAYLLLIIPISGWYTPLKEVFPCIS